MKKPYKKLEDGEWYPVPQCGRDRSACCDCGLVHDVETRVLVDPIGNISVEQRHYRNARATAQVRRGMLRRGEL